MITAVMHDLLPGLREKMRKAALGISAFFLFALHGSVFTHSCYAADKETNITSETLQYFSDQKKYVAKGAVTVERDDATVHADEMTYFEETGDVQAVGNVRYNDPGIAFTAQRAELNMEKKTGRLYEGDVLFKEDNYHLSGNVLERKGEKEFSSKEEARFTTCDAVPAAWCFRGKDVNLFVGSTLTARDASLRVREVPVLYTPYLLAPLLTERQTGFLMPLVSNSSTRGFGLNIPFFWAIAENRDATFVLDTYSKRGIGTGMEYRFVEPGGIKSNWWIYHIRDNELHKDFTEFKAMYEKRSGNGPSLFANVALVNERDFYREFNPNKEKQILRYLESTGEFSLPFENSRLYLLGQYWTDLDHDTGDVPQRLPEVGYVKHYTRFGSFMVSADTSAVNFWLKNGVSANRFDIYPRVLHSMGDNVVLTQIFALRGTAYAFSGHDKTESSLHREAAEYDASVNMRLYRQYRTVTHIIEPSVRYHVISSSENSIPVYDAVEYYKRQSLIEFSVLNRIKLKGQDMAALRVTQPVDTDQGDRPFLPVNIDLTSVKPLPMQISAEYDVNYGKIMTVTSSISIPFKRGSVNIGQQYNREEDVTVFKASIVMQPVKALEMVMNVWYDAKGEGLTDFSAVMKYSSQCWGVRISAAKSPDDFTLQVMFDLFGVTAKAPKANG